MVGVKGLLVLGQAATGENICIWEGRHPVLTKTMKMTKTKKQKKKAATGANNCHTEGNLCNYETSKPTWICWAFSILCSPSLKPISGVGAGEEITSRG